MLPVRYDIAAIGVRRMTKDIPRIQFQQRDIAKSFLGIENRATAGTDLVAPTDDRRPQRIGMRRASCALNNSTILIQQAEPWQFDINRAPQIGCNSSVIHRFADHPGCRMRREAGPDRGVPASAMPNQSGQGVKRHGFEKAASIIIRPCQLPARGRGVPMRSILIHCESSEVVIHPEAGASIGHWTWHGRSILYSQASLAGDQARVEAAACFPLVPFANRIGRGRLAAGTVLAPHPGEAHALHGVGWQRAWDPVAVEADRVLLALRHGADEHWPFDFLAQLDVKLGPDGLAQTLTVRNTGRRTMPAGLGLHPYFTVDATTTLSAAWTGRWTVGPDLLPVEHQACAAVNAEAVGGWTVNNCFTGWDGRATLRYGDRQVSMSGNFGRQSGFLQCYRPEPDSPFLALEPVTHVPNAHQLEAAGMSGTGLRHLRPSESMSVAMDIAVV